MNFKRGFSKENRKIFVFCFLLLWTTGCSTLSNNQTSNVQSRDPDKKIFVPSPLEVKANNRASGGKIAENEELNESIVEGDELLADDAQGKEDLEPVEIPMEINNRVAAWIKFFSEKDRARTARFLERGSALKAQIERMLEQNDVPKELFYIAMIESGFANTARSNAAAVGIWQFMPGTARNYGLKVNQYVDERKNWIKATEAAITYLKDLRNVFGSWYLAFAAYNAGEYRIVRSIIRGKTRDFWSLAEGNMLPKETLNYVPKFMAAMIIGKNPAKYNIKFTASSPVSDFDSIEVPSGISLQDLARVTGVPLEVLKRWNMDLKFGITPYDPSGMAEIYLPKDQVAKVEAKQNLIAGLERRRIKMLANNESSQTYAIYVVRSGDSLSSISQHLGISVRTLRKINRIAHTKIHPGQRLRYYTNVASKKLKHNRLIASTKPVNYGTIYTVHRGETLSSIAKKFRTSVGHIQNRNRLSSRNVRQGQQLVVD